MSAPDRGKRRLLAQLASLPLAALSRRSRGAARRGGVREIDISSYDTALLPREHGQWTPLTTPLHRRYPSRDHCMQMAAFFNSKRGLLVVVQDSKGGVSDWEIRPGRTLRIRFYGDVPEVATTAIAPTLDAAADGYRHWALQQPWVTGRQRRSQRINFFSVAAHSSQAVERDHFERVLTAAATPIGVWFTQYRRYPFDQKYPDYHAREPQEFADTLARCALRGAIAFPYVNGLLWDQTLEDFRDLGAALALRTEADDTVAYNAELANLRYACPHAPQWQRLMSDVHASLIDAHGKAAAGIYLDMVAAANPNICWSAHHDHEPGDPYAWNRGIRQLLERIDGAIMVEGNAEVYLDRVDYLLMHLYTDQADSAPLWRQVYGDQPYPVGWRLPPAVTTEQLQSSLQRARSFGVGGFGTPWMTSDPEKALFDRGVAQATLASARVLQ